MMLNTNTLDHVRQYLTVHLPRSPLDFIPNMSVNGDKEIYALELTRELPEENDLRFICELTDGEDCIVLAEKLPWDTDFFGYGIGRLNEILPLSEPAFRPYSDYSNAIHRLISLAASKRLKYLFARVDARDIGVVRALSGAGFSLIEIRAFYHMNIREYEAQERYSVRFADCNDIMVLAQTARETVNLYDRFHADPFIERGAADRLMSEWISASILGGFADVTIIPDCASPSAFNTVRYHKDKWPLWKLNISQSAVLTAISSEYRGWYRKIMSEVNYHLRDVGAEHVYMSTQVTNKAVIWVIEGLGYHFGKCELIFRWVL